MFSGVTCSLGPSLCFVLVACGAGCVVSQATRVAITLRRCSARCSALELVTLGRFLLWPPPWHGAAAARWALGWLVLRGDLHVGRCCAPVSCAVAFALTWDLPLGLCKAACLAALVWPTFGREDHPGYGQRAIVLPEPVGTPPDGWCFYYCWACWLEPSKYLAMARWPSGHLKNRGDQKRMLLAAKGVYERVLARMRVAGDEEAVVRLRSDPSELLESDFAAFAAEMGCSIEIGAGAPFSVYGSPRPVGLRVRRYQSRDGEGHLAWHYDIVGLWVPSGQASASSAASAAGGGHHGVATTSVKSVSGLV